jgi:amidase
VTNELLFKPAGELATLVHTGQVSSTELVNAALERIEQLQPSLNAFVHIDADGALEAAAGIDRDDPRPFAGVPIAIKDTTSVAGMPYTMGSDMFGDFVPGHDSHVTRRIREAGFVLVGKTNMPEFGILPVSEPRRYGPVRNPWDTERTPGGSSGGAAAAVAGGMVPLAHGSDGGGSIRIPAACTGLVGMKPSRGRISRGPDLGDDFLVQDGVLTRTVGETAALLDVLSGYELGDTTWAPPPPEPFAEAMRRDPGRLRIGFIASAKGSGTRSRKSRPHGAARISSRPSSWPSARRSRWACTSAAWSPDASRAPSSWSRCRGRCTRASAPGPRSTTSSPARN